MWSLTSCTFLQAYEIFALAFHHTRTTERDSLRGRLMSAGIALVMTGVCNVCNVVSIGDATTGREVQCTCFVTTFGISLLCHHLPAIAMLFYAQK